MRGKMSFPVCGRALSPLARIQPIFPLLASSPIIKPIIAGILVSAPLPFRVYLLRVEDQLFGHKSGEVGGRFEVCRDIGSNLRLEDHFIRRLKIKR